MAYSFLQQMYDSVLAQSMRIDPDLALLNATPVRVCGSTFQGASLTNTSDNFWACTRGTNSTSVIASSLCTLTSLTTNADWCQVGTVKIGVFKEGQINSWQARFLLNTSVTAANTTIYAGPVKTSSGVPQDGYNFAISGTGVVSVQSYSGGSTVLNASSGFNGSLGGSYTVPDVNIHTYEIIYRVGDVRFLIDGALLHTATPTNTLYAVVLNLPATVSVVNGTSPTSRVVTVWNMQISRYGDGLSRPISTNITTSTTTVLSTRPGTLYRVYPSSLSAGVATMVLYDNTAGSGTIIASIIYPAAGMPTLEFGIDTQIGLTAVTSTTGTVPNYTVVHD